jgi:hypothetical protein
MFPKFSIDPARIQSYASLEVPTLKIAVQSCTPRSDPVDIRVKD